MAPETLTGTPCGKDPAAEVDYQIHHPRLLKFVVFAGRGSRGDSIHFREISHNAAENKLGEPEEARPEIRMLLRTYALGKIERAGFDSAALLSRQVLGNDKKR